MVLNELRVYNQVNDKQDQLLLVVYDYEKPKKNQSIVFLFFSILKDEKCFLFEPYAMDVLWFEENEILDNLDSFDEFVLDLVYPRLW